MKSVLISIKPKYVELIANGEKTIEVRKTKPNLETPFKCYIYETQGEYKAGTGIFAYGIELKGTKKGRGKVIGEFVCDRIDDFYCASVPYQKENNLGYGHFVDNGVYKVNGWHEGVVFERNDRYIDSMLKNNYLKEMCLSAQEIFDYIGIGKHLYGWHITDLKIYDKPKESSEFKYHCKYEYDDDFKHCESCDYHYYSNNPSSGIEEYCTCDGLKTLSRPPQSWCYVEELQNG